MKKKIFIIVLIVCTSINLQAQKQLSVLSYNTYNGFQSDTIIQKQYITWVKKMNPDIIAYQEMKFTQKQFENFAAKYNHNFAVLSKTEGYPVAISSKYPIVNVQKVEDNMHHIYLYANTHNTHIFIVHLSPFGYQKRANELRIVLAHAATLPQDERILIMGDFNALDKSDSTYYGESLLNDMIKRDKTYNQNNLNNGVLDYSVMDLLASAGYKDSYWLINSQYQFSMPTKKYRTRSVRRIDYIWTNNKMKNDILKSGIIIDDDTENMSDHYPTYINFSIK